MNTPRFLSLLCLCFLWSNIVSSQPTPSGATCQEAIPACNGLDGISGTLSSLNIQTSFPGCPSNALNNAVWYRFTAGSDSISLQITPSNCSSPLTMSGMQGVILTGCGGPALAVHCENSDSSFLLNYDSYITGENYLLVLDGFAGAVCDYQIQVLQGATEPISPQPEVNGLTAACPGTSVEYTAGAYSLSNQTYQWVIDATLGEIIGYSPDSFGVTVVWNNPGVAGICVEIANSCGESSSDCLAVEVTDAQSIFVTGPQEVCAGTTEQYWATPLPCPSYQLAWSIFGGVGVIAGDPTASVIDVQWLLPGVGQVCLNIQDSLGFALIYCIDVEVSASHQLGFVVNGDTLLQLPTDGMVSFCEGDSIHFAGFAIDGAVPLPNDSTLTYLWQLSNGMEVAGSEFAPGYLPTGCYTLVLQAISVSLCIALPIQLTVTVIAPPEVPINVGSNGLICEGEMVMIMADDSPFYQDCQPLVQGITGNFPVPDNDSLGIILSINIDQFPAGANLQSADNLGHVMVNIRHNWADDLELTLYCPNGQHAALIQDEGGYADFGNAATLTGYDYFWTNDNGLQTVGEFFLQDFPNLPSAIPAGFYAPHDSFASLVGCPLNGVWSLIATDDEPGFSGKLSAFQIGFVQNSVLIVPNVQWQPDVSIISSLGNSILVAPDTTMTYYLEVTDNFGCINQQEVTIEVVSADSAACLPCDSLLVSAGPDQIINCYTGGVPSEIVGQSSLDGDFMDFKWLEGSSVVVEGKILPLILVGFGTFIFQATNVVTGCTASDTVSYLLDIDLPIADAGPDLLIFCAPVILDGSASSTGPDFVYEWVSATTGDTVSNNLTATVNDPDVYILTVTDTSNGCFTTDEVVIADDLFWLNGFTTPDSCGASNGLAGVIVPPTLPGLSILWNTGDTASVITNLAAGEYSATVTYLDCEATISIVVDEWEDNCTGTSEMQTVLLGFVVSPNPAAGRLDLAFELKNQARLSVSVLDLDGRQLLSPMENVLFSAGQHTVQVSLESIPAGSYFIALEGDNRQAVRKFLKIE
ncbi:MAG: T9SS type A sorting domain-containing protein [Bacteroidetes bacterium]|nr:T9SS type A sorting domain-containing protein [Bacteroidota bacterium]